MERESYVEGSESSSTSSIITGRSNIIYSRTSGISTSRSAAVCVGHLEIFSNEPEIVRFSWTRTEDFRMATRDCSLEELGLDLFICGYLGRDKSEIAAGKRDTASLAFFNTLEERCHAVTSYIDDGRTISIHSSKICLSVIEVETWILEVTELFKNVNTVRKLKETFTEMHDNIGIVKRKLNHHLKGRNVVAYTFSDLMSETEMVFAYEEDTSDFLRTLVDDIHEQGIITKSETFKEQQVQILKVRENMWKTDLADIIIGDTTVQAIGLQEDVNEVFFKIHKILSTTVSRSINLGEDEAEIFKSSSVKKFAEKQIEGLLSQQDLVWRIDGNVIRINGTNNGTVDRCAQCIKECVKSWTFSEIPDAVLSLEEWNEKLVHLENKFSSKLIIKSFDGTTKVTSTSDIYKEVLSDIRNFLIGLITHSRQYLDLFQRRYRSEKEHSSLDKLVQITRQSVGGIPVDGTGQSIAKARSIIDDIVIVTLVAWVARQDAILFLQSEEGNTLLNNVGDKNVCLIDTCQPSICIQLIDGTIEEQRVDVIVNSAAPDLSMNKGQVAKCLSRAAGPQLQKDILKQYPRGVPEGKVVRGQPGKLKCKTVYHDVLPMKPTGKEAITTMRRLMEECLVMAIDDKYESVAFPVFGTGNLTYPEDEVANTMYDVIENFALTNVEVAMTVKEIRIVMFPENSKVIKAFSDVKQKRINSVDNCKANTNKLLTNPGCPLEFYVRFTSYSKANNETSMRRLEEHLLLKKKSDSAESS